MTKRAPWNERAARIRALLADNYDGLTGHNPFHRAGGWEVFPFRVVLVTSTNQPGMYGWRSETHCFRTREEACAVAEEIAGLVPTNGWCLEVCVNTPKFSGAQSMDVVARWSYGKKTGFVRRL